MKLLNVQQIRDWDSWTIRKEAIASTGLMERAGKACTEYLLTKFSRDHAFLIYCGQGNNGGDGLVIARLLSGYGYRVAVLIVQHSKHRSEDFLLNLDRLRKVPEVSIREIGTERDIRQMELEDPEQQRRGVMNSLLGSGITDRKSVVRGRR